MINSTKIVPFQCERTTFTVFFSKISVLYLQWTKRTGKQKSEEHAEFVAFPCENAECNENAMRQNKSNAI